MIRVERALTALRIAFTRRGDRLWAQCPFHEDQDPSWFVRRSGERAGQHHCFACKAGGPLDSLIKHVLKTSDAGARAWLEKLDAGEAPGPAEAPEFIIAASRPGAKGFALPREVRCTPLGAWPSIPRAYATARGLTPEQVERWGIGYAPEGRLAGRLVIVVRDAAGRARNYMARDFTGGEPRRYLYPAAVDRPDLDVVFGEQHWPASNRRRVVVTEGALDALAVERAVGGTVAALGGSMVRPLHVAKLGTFREVVVLTDSDAAGDAAADVLGASLGRHAALLRVRLPEGKDAASVSSAELEAALCETNTNIARCTPSLVAIRRR
jgi:DNA primase